MQPFGHNTHGPISRGAAVPPCWRGELGPHLTQSAGHTVLDSVASRSIELFGTIHQRHRQDRSGRQWSDSIRRTVKILHKNNFTCAVATWRDTEICFSPINSVGLPHPFRSNLTPGWPYCYFRMSVVVAVIWENFFDLTVWSESYTL